MVCLVLELVGPCVVLGFSVGMEAFDELLSPLGLAQRKRASPRQKPLDESEREE